MKRMIFSKRHFYLLERRTDMLHARSFFSWRYLPFNKVLRLYNETF